MRAAYVHRLNRPCAPRFLWDDDGDNNAHADTDGDGRPLAWERRVARYYYDRLFREYAIADLSRAATTGQIGLRWRTQAEVISGRGQFTCAARGCAAASELVVLSWCVFESFFVFF